MLRITQRPFEGVPDSVRQTELLVLEGTLSGPWVSELETVAATHSEGGSLSLDLSRVHFVDPTGLRLLLRLLANGARLHSASPFVHELLHTR